MITDEIIKKCILLGALRVFVIKNVFDSLCPDDEESEEFLMNIFYENLEGIVTISKSIGLEITGLVVTEQIIFPKFWEAIGIPSKNIKDYILPNGRVDVNLDNFFSNSIKTIIDDKFCEKIEEYFGRKYSLAFRYSQWLFLTRPLSSLIQQLDLRDVPKDRRGIIRSERSWAIDFIKYFGETILKEKDSIRTIFGNNYSKELFQFAKTVENQAGLKNWGKNVFEESSQIANQLVPHYFEIVERLERSKELIKELKNCQIGIKNWEDYENICLKVLRYLFIPPFNIVRIQARSEGNSERRDAVIPNNQHSGFWQNMRIEFDCKHIVFEFKNGVSGNSKNALNQLRIYLSKPTVGRFGVLLVREKPSKALLQAQRDAYEQSKILILILDDEKLIALMKSRAYLGTVDDYLINEKFEFEINY